MFDIIKSTKMAILALLLVTSLIVCSLFNTVNVFNARKAVKQINIADQHLFGRAGTFAASFATQTRLPLTLQGILGDNVIKDAKALISVAGRIAKEYGINDVVAGTKIKSILPNKVILDNNGQEEELPLMRETLE